MESVRLAFLLVTLLATCRINGVLSRSGCALFGCDEGWECDTSYHLSGNCVEVFTDADINGDALDGDSLFADVENDGQKVMEENKHVLSQILVEQLSAVANNDMAEELSRAAVGATDQLRTEVAPQDMAAADSDTMPSNGGAAGGPSTMKVTVPLSATNTASTAGSTSHGSSEPKLSACQALHSTEARQCRNLIGCFVTACEGNGDFSPMQCQASTGYCWCVDALGNKLVGSESGPGQGELHCQHSSGSPSVGAVRETAATVATEVLKPPYVLESERDESDVAAGFAQAEEDDYVHVPEDILKVAGMDGAEVDSDIGDMLQLSSSRTSAAASAGDGDGDGDGSQAASSTPPSSHLGSGLDAADVLLWVIVACCIAFVVSIPLLFVCLYRAMRRPSDPSKPYIFYNRNVTTAASSSSQLPSDRDKELLLRTARNYRHGSVSTSSEKSVVLPTQQSAEAVHGHMEIYTGHKVLEYLEEHMTNPEKLSQEWKGVSAYKADDESTSDAQSDYNAGKNRYPDILPYNDHRVKLDSSNNASRSNYINASTICDRSPRYASYIATQGPLDRTVADFWQMVWEMGSSIIVMLTKLHDGGMSQCHRYWPQHGQQVYHMFEVQLVSEHIMSDDYCVRSFYLVNLKTKMTRTVTQYQFLSWPHLAVPSEAQPLLEFRRKVKKSFSDATTPIVVHDNAGVGRAGCYILIDILLNRLVESVVKEIDMAACVEHLRDQRMLMVQTEEQFRFAYTALLVELRAILDAMPK